MRRSASIGVAAALALSLSATARQAAAEPSAAERSTAEPAHELRLDLAYSAPPDCPSAERFIRTLSRRLGDARVSPLPSRVRVDPLEGEYELQVEVQLAGRTWTKAERVASCEEAVEIAAFDVAMARIHQPSLMDAMREAVAMGRTTTAERGASDPAARPPEPSARPRPTPDAADELATGARPAPPVDRPRDWVVGAVVRTGLGVMPAVAWGAGASVRLGFDAVQLELDVLSWMPQTTSHGSEATRSPRLRYSQQSGQLGLCWERRAGESLSFGACGELAGHLLRVETDDLGGSQGSRSWASWGLGAAGRYRLTRHLLLETKLSLHSALLAPEIVVAHDGARAFQPDSTLLSVQALVGWAWDGEPANGREAARE